MAFGAHQFYLLPAQQARVDPLRSQIGSLFAHLPNQAQHGNFRQNTNPPWVAQKA